MLVSPADVWGCFESGMPVQRHDAMRMGLPMKTHKDAARRNGRGELLASYRDNRRTKVTPEILAEARGMLANNDRASVAAYIERESGCCHRTATKAIEDMTGPIRLLIPRTERMTMIRQMAHKGMLPKAIAAELELSEVCIRKTAREAGIRFQSGRREAVK